MKRLHWFLLKSYMGPLILTFFITLFILLMQFLWKYIDDLTGKGLEWTIIAELILYISARLVPMALPLAVLLSSIMTFGNLGENFELTAIKSAGISLQRFMTPLIVLITFISIGAFFYANRIIPYSNLRAVSLLYDVKKQRPELQIKEGVFYNGIEGFSIKISEKNPNTNLLRNIMIYDHRGDEGNTFITVADSGYMKLTENSQYLILSLYEGYTYEEQKENKRARSERKYPHQRQYFKSHQEYFELTGFDFSRSDEDLFKNNFQMLDLDQLEFAVDSLTNKYTNRILNFTDRLEKESYFQNEKALTKTLIEETKKIKSTKKIIKKAKQDSSLKIDSIRIAKYRETQKLMKLGIDSFFKQLPLKEQLEITQTGLNYARAVKNSISNSKKSFNYQKEHIRRHQIEWHRKFSLSFACLVFFFIGAPFGAIVRKGGLGTPVVISVLFFIIYYVISITTEKFARDGILTPFIGMWLASAILLPVGIFLTYKATTDSVILNTDTYLLFLKNIFKKKKKQDTE